MPLRRRTFWALSLVGIPVVYTVAAYCCTLLEAKHRGSQWPNFGLRVVFVACIVFGLVQFQKRVPANVGGFDRVALALVYVGCIFFLTMTVTFIVLLFIFGSDSNTY
jgi:hypothetical protein